MGMLELRQEIEHDILFKYVSHFKSQEKPKDISLRHEIAKEIVECFKCFLEDTLL